MKENEITRREMLKEASIGLGLLSLSGLLGSCRSTKDIDYQLGVQTPASVANTPDTQGTPETTPTSPSVTETKQPVKIPELLRDPSKWKDWPVAPEWIHPEIISMYTQGIKLGENDAHVFSKAGDCQSVPSYLFGRFDKPNGYKLGKYSELESTIKWFKDSWSWFPPTVHGGQNAANTLMVGSLLKYDNNHQPECKKTESYLDCEVSKRKPSILLISYEQELQSATNYKKYLNMMVDYSISHKIIPIVTTCANSETINAKVAEVAVERNIPTWNFWRGVQTLEHIFAPGLNDSFHLSYEGEINSFDFTDPKPTSWNIRNLTGLQTLHSVLSLVNNDYRNT